MISIIIPIFNKASVLERCLKSVQEQTFSDIEVLMINDGSSDDSEIICKRYEKNDRRFRYIYQDNAGVSEARNKGLCNMQGNFFTFIDSDDWVEPEYCRKLFEKANNNNSDIVFCGINYWSNGVKQPQTEPALIDVVENRRIEHFLIGHKEYAIGSSCRILFRRSVIGATRFDKELHIYEDLIFLLTAISLTNRMSLVNDCLYNYDLPETNYFKKYDRENFFDICYKIGIKLYGLLMEFGCCEWAKAELFKEYCLAVDWIDATEKEKKKKIKKLKSHDLTKDFCIKENYVAYKKLYAKNNFNAKVKVALLYRKCYGIFMLYRSVHCRKK